LESFVFKFLNMVLLNEEQTDLKRQTRY